MSDIEIEFFKNISMKVVENKYDFSKYTEDQYKLNIQLIEKYEKQVSK